MSELLIATAILVFVLAGLLMLFIKCSGLNAANRNLTIAASHAQHLMEDIKNTGTLQNIKNKINNGDWNLNTAAITAMGLRALPAESITTCCCAPPCTQANPCVSPCPNSDPLGIYLRVNWQDRDQRARNIEVCTSVTNY